MTINNSTVGDDCPIADEYGRGFVYLQAVLYCVIVTVSLFGNMAVIVVVHQNKSMRTFTNILICNSAVADLLITLIPNVYEIVNVLEFDGRWYMGSFMCSFLYMCNYLSVAATVTTLTVVTIDRFCAVMLPYKKYFKKEQIPFFILGIWVVAFLFSSPTTFIQKVVYESTSGGNVCMEIWPEPPLNRTESPKHYTIVLFVCLYAFPLLLMAFMYAIMAQKLRGRDIDTYLAKIKFKKMKNQKKSKNKTEAKEEDRTPCRSSTIAIQNNTANFGKAHKRRVIRMLMAVVLGFALCWLPVYIAQFLSFFHPSFIRCPHVMPSWISFFAYFMQYANSALSPVIYFTFSQTYRKGFNSVLGKFFKTKRATKKCYQVN